MKRGNLENWEDLSGCQNLLLFSQLVNELLFDYSIPSNRVSTLNSHFLCLDAINAINSIEEHGVPEGTLKPIMEELYSALGKDPVFDKVSIKPIEYFLKYQVDKYIISRPHEMSYADLKRCALAINTYFFVDDNYYKKLRDMIIEIIERNNLYEQKKLFRLIKSMLTELMNMGYSLKYIYGVMRKIFWEPETPIVSPKLIRDFFDNFSLEKGEYEVICVVKKSSKKKYIASIEGMVCEDRVKPRTKSKVEKEFLNVTNGKGFIRIKIKSLDYFKAADECKKIMSDTFALYRLYDHKFRYDIYKADIGVYYNNKFYKISKKNVAPLEHIKMLSTYQLTKGLSQYGKALESLWKKSYGDFISIVNAARFHSNSLDSSSKENQLLDLWAIFESVLDISNAHTSDRIIQVCMYLVPIIKRGYIYSLFEQLANDIKNYNLDLYIDIVGENSDGDVVVRKISEWVLLENHKRDDFIQNCHDFPLLKERIQYYHEELSDTSKVYNFVEKHAERVKWQVMRIYRNRNLIIHNADSMPYLELLIENLHSYVDAFLEYSINNLANEHTIESMCQNLFIKECKWVSNFRKNKQAIDESKIEMMLSI